MLEAAAALESLKAAFDLTKSFVDVASSAKFQSQLIDLQRQIIEAQSQVMTAVQTEAALTQRIKALEQALVDVKNFVADAQRYPLTEVGTGAFAHVGQATEDPTSPVVWLCAPCFGQHKKSILQAKPDRVGQRQDKTEYACPSCRASIAVFYSRGPGRAPPSQ